eukprot:PhF_6_TR25661/c0_g1_i1/m.36132
MSRRASVQKRNTSDIFGTQQTSTPKAANRSSSLATNPNLFKHAESIPVPKKAETPRGVGGVRIKPPPIKVIVDDPPPVHQDPVAYVAQKENALRTKPPTPKNTDILGIQRNITTTAPPRASTPRGNKSTDILGVQKNFPNPQAPQRPQTPRDIFGNPIKQFPPPPPPEPLINRKQRGVSPIIRSHVPKIPWTTENSVSDLLCADGHFEAPLGMGTIANRQTRGRIKGTAPNPASPRIATPQPVEGHQSVAIQVGTQPPLQFMNEETQVIPETPRLESRHGFGAIETLRRKVLGIGKRWGMRGFRSTLFTVDQDRDGCVDRVELIIATQRYGSTIPLAEMNLCVQYFLNEDSLQSNLPRPRKEGLIHIDTIMNVLRGGDATWSLERQKVTKKAFETVDTAFGKSRVCVRDLCKFIKVKEIPSVLSQAQSEQTALMHFANLWLKSENSEVSLENFVELWKDVSPGLPQENDFVNAMKKMWSVTDEPKKPKLSEDDVPDLPYPTEADMKKLFQRLDDNNSGSLSLAELDKAVVSLWPKLNNKPAIMRAYKLCDEDNSGWITFVEFPKFLKYLVVYNRLWLKFKRINTAGDRRVTFEELKAGSKYLGLGAIKEKELREIFDSIDTNGGGYILFDEFCMWMGKRIGDAELSKDTNAF